MFVITSTNNNAVILDIKPCFLLTVLIRKTINWAKDTFKPADMNEDELNDYWDFLNSLWIETEDGYVVAKFSDIADGDKYMAKVAEMARW